MDKNKTEINWDLLKAIKYKGSQKYCAEKTGIHGSRISELINGHRIPTPAEIKKLEKYTGKNYKELFK